MVRLTQGAVNLELIAVAAGGQSGLRLTMGAVADASEPDNRLDLLVGAKQLGDFVLAAPEGEQLQLKVVPVNKTARKLTVAWPKNAANFPTCPPALGNGAGFHVKNI